MQLETREPELDLDPTEPQDPPELDYVRIEKAIRYLDSDYGSTTLYTMITEDGNVVKWFASNDILGEEIGARRHVFFGDPGCLREAG